MPDDIQSLRDSERTLRAYLEAMPSQVWTAGLDGRLDWFNARVYLYSGARPGELDGEGWTGMVLPDDLPIAAERWGAALAAETVYETEFRLRDAAGQYRWYLTRAVPIRDDAGRVIQWIGTNTDIHDRKLSEAEHARDRDRLWSLSRDLMLVCDFAGTITTVNPSATRILGWREDEMVGRPVVEFLHPEDLASTAAEVAKLEQGITTLAFESRYRARDGGYRLLDWTAVPHAGRIHAIGRDITEQRAIARERDRTWALSPVIKFVTNAEAVTIAVNPSWTQVLGWAAEQMIGRPLRDVLVPEEREASRARQVRLLAGEALPEYQTVFLTRSGGRRRIAFKTVHENGTIYGFGRDVTAEHEAATALRAAEEALRQSQKMEAIGQLTGGIAHDFNNLLAGILGSMDLLRRRIEQGRYQETARYLDAATTSANRAAALTARLLAFGRRQSLDTRPTDINALVTGLEDLLARTLGEAIGLQTILKAGLWPALTDANQFESALLNLAINARDAMPGGGKLTIETNNTQLDQAYTRAFEGLAPGEYVVMCVSDTGQGMPPEVIAKAFDPFFTTKPQGQGTGLGLSMIYGFAKQADGHVRIYSEPGQGTTIKLYMPRHRGKIPAEAEPFAAEAPRGAGETVLVVEDDPAIRMLVMETLSELGYEAEEAFDGRSALPRLEDGRRLDLLVTDVGLPGGMNGRQIADAARAARPELKVLFITGYAEGAVVRAGFLDPGMEMITKPFALEALAAKIREMIEG